MLTPKQAWAIAHLVHELRPEWESEGIVAALKKCADRNPYLVALASIRAAADPNTRTPGVIPTQGTHWSKRIDVEPFRPPRKSEDCRKHPGNWATGCPGCAADKLAGDDSTYNPRRSEAGPRAEHVRASLIEAKARNCPCGIDPMHCADHDPRRAKQETDETEEQGSDE